MPELTHELLLKKLDYNPSSGEFTWLGGYNQRNLVGRRSGAINSHGYRKISLLGKKYSEHRLAWFYTYQEWPEETIDHINGIKHDNRLDNLRLASKQQQRANIPSFKNNSSGHKGIWYRADTKKWVAEIQVDGNKKSLGNFEAQEDASEAYEKAAKKYFGEYIYQHGSMPVKED